MSRSVSVPRDAVGVAYFYTEPDGEREYEDDIMHNLKYQIRHYFPSVRLGEGKGIDRACFSIAENDHGYFVVAEYCGLWSLSVVPKEGPFARSWCRKASAKLNRIIRDDGLEPLEHIATASNGEAFYRPVKGGGPVHVR